MENRQFITSECLKVLAGLSIKHSAWKVVVTSQGLVH